MPLFINRPSPIVITDMFSLANGTAAITAGFAFYTGFTLQGTTTFSKMRTVLGGAPTGNIDLGIYDATGTNGLPGTLLGHTGAQTSATGVFTKNLLANTTLSPGQYWLALVDTVADTFNFFNSGAAGMGAFARSNAGGLSVLPATAGAASAQGQTFAMEALVLNGFS